MERINEALSNRMKALREDRDTLQLMEIVVSTGGWVRWLISISCFIAIKYNIQPALDVDNCIPRFEQHAE